MAVDQYIGTARLRGGDRIVFDPALNSLRNAAVPNGDGGGDVARITYRNDGFRVGKYLPNVVQMTNVLRCFLDNEARTVCGRGLLQANVLLLPAARLQKHICFVRRNVYFRMHAEHVGDEGRATVFASANKCDRRCFRRDRWGCAGRNRGGGGGFGSKRKLTS